MNYLRQSVIASITRRYPLFSGCGTIANSKLIDLLLGEVTGKVWSKVPGGEVLADINDYVGRSAFFTGDLDRKITWICKQLVNKGDVVLDIGANIGMVSIWLAKLVGEQGAVHSFEPNPQLCQSLNQLIEHNKNNNIILYPYALGESEDSLKLVVPEGNAGEGSIIRHDNSVDNNIYEEDVLPLDKVVKKANINKIRLIKIDVEGFEEDVFKGAHDILTKIKPDAILFELNQSNAATLGEEPIIKLLQQYDYDFLSIPKCFFKMKLKKVDLNASLASHGHDFIAAPRGQVFKQVSELMNV